MSVSRPISAEGPEGRIEARFDYAALPASARAAVAAETEAIRGLLARSAESVIQIGLRLRFVRDRLGRRNFQPWLRAEFRWSASVASNYMRAAAEFADVDCVGRFQPSALFILSRKKVRPAVRAEAVRLARDGERVTKSAALRLVARTATASDRPRRRDLRTVTDALGKLSLAEAEIVADELARVLLRLREEPTGPPTASPPASTGRQLPVEIAARVRTAAAPAAVRERRRPAAQAAVAPPEGGTAS